MSNKVYKNRNNKQEEEKKENLEQENANQDPEGTEDADAGEKPAQNQGNQPPLNKAEGWFCRNAERLDDIGGKVVKVGKWVLGGALLIGVGALVHKGLSDDEPMPTAGVGPEPVGNVNATVSEDQNQDLGV